MTVAESLDPDESVWHLIAFHLRFERQKRGLSQSQMGQLLGMNRHGVSNLEAARNRLTQDQARRLDRAWDTGGLWQRLRRLAILLGRDGDWTKQLRDFETGALVIKVYIEQLIPVPLQTEAYARHVIRTARVVRDVEEAVRQRMARTKMLLDQLADMDLWVLIDERALHMPEDIQREQLAALLDFADRLSLRIVPDAARVHAGIDGSFELITTAAGTDIGYVWAQLAGRLVHEAPDVRELALRYDRIGAKALTEEGSRELIVQMLERLQ